MTRFTEQAFPTIEMQQTLEFWKALALNLKDELANRGDEIDALIIENSRLREQIDNFDDLTVEKALELSLYYINTATALMKEADDE